MFDQVGSDPAAVVVQQEYRRGEKPLPLKTTAWNHCKLALQGDHLELFLNGTLVYSRPLEATDQRVFGLFRYADQEYAKVRNVIWRGAWPSLIPEIPEQQLADHTLHPFDVAIDAASVFDHSFVEAGVPSELFDIPKGIVNYVTATANGVVHTKPANARNPQSKFASRIQLNGDFDIEARFDELQMARDELAACAIFVKVEGGYSIEMKRQCLDAGYQRIHITWRAPAVNGQVRFAHKDVVTAAVAGRFRLTRRKDTFYTLFAEGDSSSYRLIDLQTYKGVAEKPATAYLAARAHGPHSVSVVWKSLRLSARKLMKLPAAATSQKAVVFVMNADGSDVRQVTKQQTYGAGSPKWSPDGKQIVFDVWTGVSATTNIFRINVDGTGLLDPGNEAAMPNYSKDGKRLTFQGLRTGGVHPFN